jgi:hypothetical protein
VWLASCCDSFMNVSEQAYFSFSSRIMPSFLVTSCLYCLARSSIIRLSSAFYLSSTRIPSIFSLFSRYACSLLWYSFSAFLHLLCSYFYSSSCIWSCLCFPSSSFRSFFKVARYYFFLAASSRNSSRYLRNPSNSFRVSDTSFRNCYCSTTTDSCRFRMADYSRSLRVLFSSSFSLLVSSWLILLAESMSCSSFFDLASNVASLYSAILTRYSAWPF